MGMNLDLDLKSRI